MDVLTLRRQYWIWSNVSGVGSNEMLFDTVVMRILILKKILS